MLHRLAACFSIRTTDIHICRKVLFLAVPAMLALLLGGLGNAVLAAEPERQPPDHPAIVATRTFTISTFENAEALVKPMQQVISQAYGRLGIRVNIQRLPLTRSLSEANAGRFDGELGRVRENAKEAPNLLLVPEPIGETAYHAYMLREHAKPELASWEALRTSGLRIGGRLGARVPEVKLGDALNVRNQTQQALIKMLGDDRVDVVVGTMTTTRAILATMKTKHPELIAQIVELQPPLQLQPFYHFLHQRHAALLPLLSAEFAAMQKDGSIARIWREAAEQQAEQ